MVTDWLHNQNAALLVTLAVTLPLSLALALSRRILPPTEAKWQMIRSLFIAICYGLGAFLAEAHGVGEAIAASLVPGGFYGNPKVALLPYVCSAVLFGFLIPVVVEERTVAEMGWVRHRAWLYAVLGLLGGLIFRLLARPTLAAPEWAREDFRQPLGYLTSLPIGFIGTCVAWGIVTAFAEEGLFRGHVLQSLRGAGVGSWAANHLQAFAFALCHPHILSLWRDTPQYPPVWAKYVAIYLLGLLLGYLRFRTGSIVPGFAFQAAGNAALYILLLGPMAAVLSRLL